MKTIRLWRIGHIDLEGSSTILPTREALDQLRSLINKESMREDGIMDIIWGPELSLDVVTHPDVDDEVVDLIEFFGEDECES